MEIFGVWSKNNVEKVNTLYDECLDYKLRGYESEAYARLENFITSPSSIFHIFFQI